MDEKKYSILEEVSKQGFYWTAFHFASHYGKSEVLNVLIDRFYKHRYKEEIFNLQTAEGSKLVSNLITIFLVRNSLILCDYIR